MIGMKKTIAAELEQFTIEKFCVIEVFPGMTRPIAELFVTRKGVVFADVGWYSEYGCSWHPFHEALGKILRDGDRWTVGESIIREVDELENDTLTLHNWANFKENDEKGKVFATREECRKQLKKGGFI